MPFAPAGGSLLPAYVGLLGLFSGILWSASDDWVIKMFMLWSWVGHWVIDVTQFPCGRTRFFYRKNLDHRPCFSSVCTLGLTALS